jgi:hypothetical protein
MTTGFLWSLSSTVAAAMVVVNGGISDCRRRRWRGARVTRARVDEGEGKGKVSKGEVSKGERARARVGQ